MTKTSILGSSSNPAPQQEIKFIHVIRSDAVGVAGALPKQWNNIILLSRGSIPGELDKMYAYDNRSPQSGYVYLGHWNDGVVK